MIKHVTYGQEATHNEHQQYGIFNWVSKVIRVLLWFCFTSLCDWLKNLAPLSRPIRSKTQTNQSRLARARTFFPALDASNMYLLRVLIGSLDNLCLLWLAGVITLVLVLRHSFEKRSVIAVFITFRIIHWILFCFVLFWYCLLYWVKVLSLPFWSISFPWFWLPNIF